MARLDAARTQKLEVLRALKEVYAAKGIDLMGVFGSFARGEEDAFSDMDIAYSIDYEIFSKTHTDGFSKILELEEMKKTLESKLHSRVDLVSLRSQNREFLEAIQKEMIYV